MALIHCKECNYEFSDLAAACPKCAAPTSYSLTGTIPTTTTTASTPVLSKPPIQVPARPLENDAQTQHVSPENFSAHHLSAHKLPHNDFSQEDIAQDSHHQQNVAHSNFPAQAEPAYPASASSSYSPYSPAAITVSPLLILGIIFFPFIFVWFLLRDGYSRFARIAGFCWFGFVVVFFGFVLYTAASIYHDLTSDTVASTDNSDTPIELSAQQFFSDYSNNELSADTLYKGKALLLTGEVDEIKKDFSDDTYLTLKTDHLFRSVRAKLNDDQLAKAASLQQGQTVVLKCIGSSMMMGSPAVKNCTIVRSQRLPTEATGQPPQMSMAEITAAADDAAASANAAAAATQIEQDQPDNANNPTNSNNDSNRNETRWTAPEDLNSSPSNPPSSPNQSNQSNQGAEDPSIAPSTQPFE